MVALNSDVNSLPFKELLQKRSICLILESLSFEILLSIDLSLFRMVNLLLQ